MGKILGYVYTFLSIFLAIPTVLILITWNTTPDQPLYPVKRALEQVPRYVLKLDPQLAATYEVKITDRRFDEASKLIAYSNTLGLKELNKSLIESKTAVLSGGNAAAKRELITNLQNYRQKLDVQKTQLQIQTPAPSSPTSQPEPTAAEKKEAVVQITETEKIIEEVIVDVGPGAGTSSGSDSGLSGTSSDTKDSSPSGTKILRRTLVKTTTTTTTNPDGTVTVNISTSSSVIDETPIK